MHVGDAGDVGVMLLCLRSHDIRDNLIFLCNERFIY